MKLIKVCTLGVALSLIAGAGWAQGQGGGGGRPGAGRPGFGGPGGFGGGMFGGGGGLGGLLRMPEVQTELKLDDAQKDLIEQINQEMGQKMRTMFQPPQGGQPGERPQFDPAAFQEMQKKMAVLRTDQDKKIGEVLDAKQMTRLKQLSIQQGGTRSLARPEVQDQLKLNADQKSKIETAQTGEREAMQTIFPRPQEGQQPQRPTEEQFAQMRQKMTDLRTATDNKILGVLTDAQKKQFTSLQGAPFKFPEFRGFGGPGGGGGRRPGGNN